MTQKYEVWDAVEGRNPTVSIDALIDDWEGFRLLLREHDTERVIRVAFDRHVGYQCRDETDLDGEASRSEGLMRGCFYIVKDSEFVARITADTPRDYAGIRHFAIITDTDCVDVLSLSDPTVEYL